MALKDDLTAEVKATFARQWEVHKTEDVPAPKDVLLDANYAKDLEKATVLYADLDGSTNMVEKYEWHFSAEIYKTFLRCASQVIRSEGGSLAAYDGDRVMAIFTGGSKNTAAARCAMKINYAVTHIIQPALRAQYSTEFELKHVVGIDTSQLRTARVGVRGDNDLVWIGRAANYAAKLTNESGMPTRITKAVYDQLSSDLKVHDGQNMWQQGYWTSMNNMEIYSSAYWWTIG